MLLEYVDISEMYSLMYVNKASYELNTIKLWKDRMIPMCSIINILNILNLSLEHGIPYMETEY